MLKVGRLCLLYHLAICDKENEPRSIFFCIVMAHKVVKTVGFLTKGEEELVAGRYSEAKLAFEAGLALDPSDERFLQGMQRIKALEEEEESRVQRIKALEEEQESRERKERVSIAY